MKLIFAGGGTGGHINPAIAIANAARARYSHNEILFVGTRQGLESILVPKAGYKIKYIDIEGFIRKTSFHNVIVMGKMLTSLIKSMIIIKRFKPDAVVGTGGYVSGPVLLAASLLKIPTVIHEQNAAAGVTSRMLSKYADRICVAFPNKDILGVPEKTIITGNPVRNSFKNLNTKESKRLLGLDDGLPFILCVSGSLGSQKISEYMTDYIKNSYDQSRYHLMVVTGDLYYEDVMDELNRCNISLKNTKIYIKNYIHDIEKYISAADLIISRAGAIFLSEIAFLGKPSILIPSPNVAENHQEKNADAYVNAGCSLKITEKSLSKHTLADAIEGLILNPGRLKEMSEKALELGSRAADEAILDVVESVSEGC